MNTGAKIAIVYGHVSRNHGDNAITEGIVQALHRTAPDASVRIVCSKRGADKKPFMRELCSMQESRDSLSITLYDQEIDWGASKPMRPQDTHNHILKHTDEVLDSYGIRDCDIVLYNSSEHLYSYNESDDATLILRLAPIVAAIEAGKLTYCLPCTFGPFQTEFSRSLFRSFLTGCAGGAARDARSLAELNQHLAGTDSTFNTAEVMADAAFLRDYATTSQPRNELVGLVPRLDGFGLRAGKARSQKVMDEALQSGFEHTRAFQVYANAAYVLGFMGKTCRFLIQNPNDQPLAEAIIRAIQTWCPSTKCEMLGASTIDEYVGHLADCSMVVSSRFHSHIFAYSMSIPALGIYFPEQGLKIPGLMESFQQSQFCLDGSTTGLVDLSNALISLTGTLATQAPMIRQRVVETRAALDSMLTSWLGVEVP